MQCKRNEHQQDDDDDHEEETLNQRPLRHEEHKSRAD